MMERILFNKKFSKTKKSIQKLAPGGDRTRDH